MKKIDIIENMELPPKNVGRKLTIPLSDLEIGAGFIIPGTENSKIVRQRAYAYGKRHDKKFATRVTAEGTQIKRIV